MKTQEKLKQYIQENSTSLAAVARATAMSDARLSLWVNGKYEGDNKEVELAVASFLQREEEKKSLIDSRIPFVMTKSASMIIEAARLCHLEGEMGIIFGKAGIGKTWAIREYQKQNPGVVIIETTLGFTAKYLFHVLTEELGIKTSINVMEMFRDCQNRLMESTRMIIVDEAEHLPYRAHEMLRRLHDFTGVAILFVGQPVLVKNFMGKRGEYDQLWSRIGLKYESKDNTADDISKIIANVIPNSNGLYKVFHDYTKGNLRTLNKLYKRANKMARLNDCDIDEAIISESAKRIIRV